jgi:hypothetical protein
MATDNKIRDNNSAALWTVAIIVIIAIAAWAIYKEYHKQPGATYSSPTVSGTATPETGNRATQ